MGQLKNKDGGWGALVLLTPRFCQASTRQGSETPASGSCSARPLQGPWSTHRARAETEAQRGPDVPWSHSQQHRPEPPHTHPCFPLPCHDSFPSLGRLLPSAADSSLGRESKVCWSRRSRSASQTQPLTAKGCHPFSVHLICLKTMKKNLSRLFASAAAVIYGVHQSPPSPAGTLLLPQTPQGWGWRG